MIDLTGAILVGQGNERSCFVHPYDSCLVIKVPRQAQRSRQQNRIDLFYLDGLVRRGVPFNHIPRLHGMVVTSLGEGLVCERIAEPDGSNSPPLALAVRRGLLTRERADGLLDELLVELLRYWVVIVDVAGNHVLFQQLANGHRRLVIIDGLGARWLGWRLWIQSKIPSMARRKLRKQWPKLLFNIWSGPDSLREGET